MNNKRGVSFRIEKDILGKVKIPNSSYYGIFTQRAKENFPISNLKIEPEMNKSIIEIKIVAARANAELRILDKKIAFAIIKAGEKILKNYSDYEEQFILDVFQAGAGTPWHMNVNEAIANVALELSGKKKGIYKFIDPHDQVNKGQSTNDVIPTAIRIASLKLVNKLIVEIKELIKGFKTKGKEFRNFAKAGRTHLQDAVPITLGMEFNAWASDLEKRLKTISNARNNLCQLNIGGTAIGTGFNTYPRFAKLTIKYLRKITHLPLVSARNKIEETQFMSDFLDLSESLRTLATDLNKIANDMRLISSGPMTGLREITLPKVESGSSIMPYKFNPSMAEMLNMVCFQVMGNDETIQQATEAGQLELNVFTPIIAHNLLQSIKILTNGIREFNNRCVKGIKANKKVLQDYFEKTPAAGTILNKLIGYERTAEVIKEAMQKNKSVKELVIEKNILSKKEADKFFSRKSFRI